MLVVCDLASALGVGVLDQVALREVGLEERGGEVQFPNQTPLGKLVVFQGSVRQDMKDLAPRVLQASGDGK